MEKTQKQLRFEFKLTAIELLEFSINFKENILTNFKIFHYNLNIEHRIIEEKKLVIVTIKVSVLHEDQETVLASVKASCVYEFINFDELINKQGSNIALHDEAIITINSITISTIRGIMFSLFRGTFLHTALLPVIDPKMLKANVA